MKNKNLLPILLILLLGFLLRIIFINQSLWLDEATSLTVVKNFNLSQIVLNFSPGDFHPPLYYLFIKIWTWTFGINEISARLMSALFGLATVFVVYMIGKKIKGNTLGLIAAILLTTSPLHIYYSQEARMYSMETFFVSLGILLFIRVLEEQTVLIWFIYSLVLCLIGMTDYLPLLILPVFWLTAFLSKKPLKWWTAFIFSHIPLALLFYFWSPIFSRQLSAGISVSQTFSGWWLILGKSNIKELLLVPTKFIIGRISFDNKFIYGLIVTILAAINGVLYLKAVKDIKKYLLVFLWLLIPLTFSFLLGFKLSVFSYFRLIFILPAFYLISSFGLIKIKQELFPIIFLALVLTNVIFSMKYLLTPKFHRENWKDLVAFIEKESLGKKSEVLFVADSQMEAFKYYSKSSNVFGPSGLSGDYQLVWLLRYVQPVFDPSDKLKSRVEESKYMKKNEYDFNGVVVWRYEK